MFLSRRSQYLAVFSHPLESRRDRLLYPQRVLEKKGGGVIAPFTPPWPGYATDLVTACDLASGCWTTVVAGPPPTYHGMVYCSPTRQDDTDHIRAVWKSILQARGCSGARRIVTHFARECNHYSAHAPNVQLGQGWMSIAR